MIVSHTDATGTGEARARIDLDTLPDAAGQEVILLGRISGTFAVRRLTRTSDKQAAWATNSPTPRLSG